MVTARLSTLTLPESPARRARVSVCLPAVSVRLLSFARAHVFQSAVVGSVSVEAVPPSIAALSVRVVVWLSPPVLLA